MKFAAPVSAERGEQPMEDDNQRTKSISDPDSTPAFIHSALDDYGLSMAQFRLFCRIARRGDDCYESVPNMAKACQMDDDTAWAALKFLEARRLVVKTRRPGQTSFLNINPIRLWLAPDVKLPTRKDGAGKNYWTATNPPDSAVCHPKRRGDHPPEKTGHKGNPYEGNPIKAQEPPRVASGVEFEPLPKTFFLREGKEMKRRLQERIDLIKADPEANETVMVKSPMGTETKRKRLKPEAASCVNAYIERIQEIARKEIGIIE